MEARTTETIPGAQGTDGFKRHEISSANFWCWFKWIPWEIISNKLVWQTFIPSTSYFHNPSTDSVRLLADQSLFVPRHAVRLGKKSNYREKSLAEINAFHLGVTSLNCSHLKDGHWWFCYVGKEAGQSMKWESRSASFFLFTGDRTQSSIDKWGQLLPPRSHSILSIYLCESNSVVVGTSKV